MQSKQYKVSSSGLIEVNEFNLPSMSEEEIKKYELEEDLPELQKAKLLLAKKKGMQMASVIFNLPMLFREQSEAVEELLPSILRDVITWEEKLQIEVAESFVIIIEHKILSAKYQKLIFSTTLKILKTWSPSVTSRWIDVLRVLVLSLPILVTQTELETLLLNLSDISQPHGSRIIAAQLVGIMADAFDKQDFIGKPMQKAIELCQDFNWEVRQHTAAQLAKVCSKIGTKYADQLILKEFEELLEDEELDVEIEALKAFVRSVDYFSKTKLADVGPKIFSSMINSEHNPIKELLVEHSGRLLNAIGYQEIKSFNEGESESGIEKLFVLIEEFTRLKNESRLKELVVYNFPAYSMLLPDEVFRERLMPIIASLSKIDSSLQTIQNGSKPTLVNSEEQPVPQDDVRNRLAAGIHEIIKIKGPEWIFKYRFDEIFFTLLEDGKPSVISGITCNLQHIFITMNPLKTPTADQQSSFIQTILKLFPKIDLKLQGNWRAQVSLYQNFKNSIKLLHPDDVLRVIQCAHFQTLHNCATPVQVAICETLCWILATIPHYAMRNYIHEQLYKHFAFSRGYKDRMVFIEFSRVAQDFFSKQYFKVSFLTNLLELGKDKIQNVLIKFCDNLRMIRLWIQNDNIKHLEKLDKTIRDLDKVANGLKMINVIESLDRAKVRLKETEFEMNTYSPGEEVEEKTRQQKEYDIHKIEKRALEAQKKKEIDDMVLQSKREFLSSTMRAKGMPSASSKGTRSLHKLKSASGQNKSKLTNSKQVRVSRRSGSKSFAPSPNSTLSKGSFPKFSASTSKILATGVTTKGGKGPSKFKK